MRFLNHETQEYLLPISTNVRPNMPLALETLQTYRLHLLATNPDKKYEIRDNVLYYVTEEVIEYYPRIDNSPNRLETID